MYVPQPFGRWILKGTPPRMIRPSCAGFPALLKVGREVVYSSTSITLAQSESVYEPRLPAMATRRVKT